MVHVLACLSYLCTGVILNTVSQKISDTHFSAPETHLIPFIKFTATVAVAFFRGPRASAATAEQRRLMALIGLLDASAYTVFCLGFFRCGATLSNLLLSGIGQVLTAAATRFVLRRRLTVGQLAGITFCGVGLAVRAAPASYFISSSSSSSSAGSADSALSLQHEQLVGAALVALASVLYTVLGIGYDKLLKGTQNPPPNAEIMWNTSILGFLASSAYQLLYTLPNYDTLVRQRMAANGITPRYIGSLLFVFGALFNLHQLAQQAVFKTEGAIGVGLVNAVRGAVITVVIAALFCSPAAQHLCLTRQTALSAAVITCGGAIYVLAGRGRQPPSSAAPKPAEGAATMAEQEQQPAVTAKDKDA